MKPYFIGQWLYGDHIDREEREFLASPGWRVLHVESLLLDIIKLIVVEKEPALRSLPQAETPVTRVGSV